MSYIEVTGKTEEEAVRKALTQLGLERDDVSLEILERAKSGFLGIGGSPARIRVTYGTDEPEEKKAEPTKKVEKKPEPKAEVKKPEVRPEPKKQEPKKPETKPVEKAPEQKTVTVGTCDDDNAATGLGQATATIRHRTGWPPVSPAALLSARERRSEYSCLWTGQENGSGVLYFILTWSETRGQHRLDAALLRFPAICGRHILFLIRRFYREINGKGTGTNEKR